MDIQVVQTDVDHQRFSGVSILFLIGNPRKVRKKSDAATFVTRVFVEWRNTSKNWNLHQHHYEMLEFCIAPNY
jgi:hypothetical protein